MFFELSKLKTTNAVSSVINSNLDSVGVSGLWKTHAQENFIININKIDIKHLF